MSFYFAASALFVREGARYKAADADALRTRREGKKRRKKKKKTYTHFYYTLYINAATDGFK